MRTRVAQRRRIEGWGFSLILHGVFLVAIIPVFRHLPTQINPEPFRWDVTFVELRQTTVVEPASDASSANRLLQTGETIEGTQARLIGDLPSPDPQPTNNNNETIQASNNVRPAIAFPTPTDLAPAKPETVAPTSSITEPTPVIQETLPILRDATTDHPQTREATTPVATESPTPVTASGERDMPPQPAVAMADDAMVTAQSREPSQAPPTSVPPIASDQPSVARSDYSWLQRALSRRLEELKRSSRPSLDDASKLKVLVKAVVSSTGELMEAEVVKSSGLDRIDREAMTLVQRAFPMLLDHALDRQQIVMRIPITYSRD
jgi:TonB family protein